MKASQRSRSSRPKKAGVPGVLWVRELAAPYLQGYRAVAVSRGALRGYRFEALPEQNKKGTAGASKRKLRAGFFVGYLISAKRYEFLNPAPLECLVFSFVSRADSSLYRQMVEQDGSVLRQTAEYIGWLTHRPPRFTLFTDRESVLVRHVSMRDWPAGKHVHYSRNFFIETLAWLVRSGLVATLRGETRTLPLARRTTA